MIKLSKIVCLIFILLFSSSALATTLKVLNLEDLVHLSDRVILGECLAVDEGIDSRGLPYTRYSFRVEDVLAGRVTDSVVAVKQFGFSSDRKVGNVSRIAGMPSYEIGRSYLLFLTPVSRLGFSSPAGLVQGVFAVSGKGSRRRVVNGLQNRNLLLNTRAAPGESGYLARIGGPPGGRHPAGPVDYRRMKEIVQALTGGAKIETLNQHRLFSPGEVAR